jgi:hypothetical protein
MSVSNQTLQTFSAITSNGHIDIAWNGLDTNGVAYSGAFVDVVVNDPAKKRVYRENAMTGFPQNFLVSYVMLLPEGSIAGDEFETMIDAVTTDVDGSGPYILEGDGSGVSGSTEIADTAPSWNSWAISLASNSCANLYYFGHGSQNAIANRVNNANSGFYVNELENFLGNSVIGGNCFFTQPFHFVFLDGCNTGRGAWSEAFGIERMQVSAAGYTTNGLVARAFVGWTSVKAFSVSGAWNNVHGNFIINFFNDWSTSGDPLQTVINRNLPGGFTAPQIWGATDLRWNP